MKKLSLSAACEAYECWDTLKYIHGFTNRVKEAVSSMMRIPQGQQTVDETLVRKTISFKLRLKKTSRPLWFQTISTSRLYAINTEQWRFSQTLQ